MFSLISARFIKNVIKPPTTFNLTHSFTSPNLSSSSGWRDERRESLRRAENNPSQSITKKEYGNVFQNVNSLMASQGTGRLFAVVQLCGKQYKVTSGDIILVEGYWPPNISDRIRLEKILLVGGNDFTLFGRPILKTGLVDIQATIIEKTLTHTKTHFKKKRRKQYLRINFQRSPNTMIRINSIELRSTVGEAGVETNPIKLF